ncbi:MAG: hypothetical protein AB1705_07635 [Verrucomicrobiota bacterium]
MSTSKTLAIALFALISTSPAAEWQSVAPLPGPNGGFVCGALNDTLFVLGGTNWRNDTKHWLDGIQARSLKTGEWKLAGKLPAPVAYAASAQTKETLYFMGGSDGSRTHQTLWELNARGQVKARAQIASATVYGGAAIVNQVLYLVCGSKDAADLSQLADACQAIDLKSGAVKSLPPFPGGKFTLPAVTALGDRVFAFTGATFAGGQVQNQSGAWAFSIRKGQWQRLRDYPFAVRGLAAIALNERYLLLGGGYKSDAEGFTNEAFIYDSTNDRYLPARALPYRAMASFALSGDHLFWLGGEDEKKHRTDRCYRIAWKALLSEATREK